VTLESTPPDKPTITLFTNLFFKSTKLQIKKRSEDLLKLINILLFLFPPVGLTLRGYPRSKKDCAN